MLVHAAAESSRGTKRGTHVVVLSCLGERVLTELESELRAAAIPHSAFREPDEPYNNQLMSIGIEPIQDRRMVRRFLRGLPLYTGV